MTFMDTATCSQIVTKKLANNYPKCTVAILWPDSCEKWSIALRNWKLNVHQT